MVFKQYFYILIVSSFSTGDFFCMFDTPRRDSDDESGIQSCATFWIQGQPVHLQHSLSENYECVETGPNEWKLLRSEAGHLNPETQVIYLLDLI